MKHPSLLRQRDFALVVAGPRATLLIAGLGQVAAGLAGLALHARRGEADLVAAPSPASRGGG